MPDWWPQVCWFDSCLIHSKANQAVPHQENRQGAHLPCVGHWARRWIDHLSLWRMASATPDLQLPHRHRLLTGSKLYCLVNRNECEQLAHGCYLAVAWLGVDPGIFRSPVWLVTVTPSSHDLDTLPGDNSRQVVHTRVCHQAV